MPVLVYDKNNKYVKKSTNYLKASLEEGIS